MRPEEFAAVLELPDWFLLAAGHEPADASGIREYSDYLRACVDAPPAPESPKDLTAWLHVRIDGREGWVREPDFERLGLEEAG